MEKVSSLMDTVKSILENDGRTKSNDKLLCALVWYKQLGSVIDNMNAVDFLIAYKEGRLTNHDTITRARRKLQEENEHLRGSNYSGRQNHQKEVKKDLGYNV